MNVTITPTKLSGAITPPPSKSQAHRYLIGAALAGDMGLVRNLADSEDIRATKRCMTALLSATPASLPLLRCGESGSTLRFLIPLALVLKGGARFTGRGRLMERPQKPYFDLFDEKGIFYEQADGVLTVRGALTPGEYRLPGNVSSQFITGLLYALPLLGGDSKIVLTTALESRGYVDMTTAALTTFGATAVWEDDRTLSVPGGQGYRGREVTVEADWSQAGFWYAARGLGNDVTITGMDPHSTQGDKVIEPYSSELCSPGGVDLDVSQCPDLVPALCAHAALRAGETTRIVNAARLRIKESDRLAAVREELCKLGAKITEGPDSLTIEGVDHLSGGQVDSHNDHRIAMMLAVAATRADGPVTITGAQSVNKSYPSFWEDYISLGGRLTKEV